MLLTFGLIALALAMVVGPVMMLQPTAGMARVARLRTMASQNGLSVQLVSKAESKQEKDLAKYSLAWNEPQRRTKETQGWSLMRMKMEHDIHYFGTWDWIGKGRITDNYTSEFKALLEALPQGYFGVVTNGSGIGLVWDEKCLGRTEEEALQEVKTLLKKFRSLLEPA